MRHCDIIALRWEDIRYDENGNALLNIIQKKTKEAISLPLSSEAIKHLPNRGNAQETEKVFAGLVSLDGVMKFCIDGSSRLGYRNM